MDINNIRIFLYIILTYEKSHNKKLIIGRHIMNGNKYSLSIKNYPDELLKILMVFCEECGLN